MHFVWSEDIICSVIIPFDQFSHVFICTYHPVFKHRNLRAVGEVFHVFSYLNS